NDLEELTTDVIYLVEGDLLFFESVENILERTEETRFAKAIAKIMAQQGKIPPTPQRKTIAL
ncbi:MAG: ABC transporter ATP-binding protein, partial [Haliscomenobacter sp.]|nr:ABC transporter ATP-binding protein [Haliscomenobacter sp.]